MEVSKKIMRIGLVDAIIVIVILGSTIYSLIRGFIKEIFLIIAIIIGVIVATKFHPAARDLLLSWIHNPTISTVVGFLLLFLFEFPLLLVNPAFQLVFSFLLLPVKGLLMLVR